MEPPPNANEMLVMAYLGCSIEEARAEWQRIVGLVNILNTGAIAPVCAGRVNSTANLRSKPSTQHAILKTCPQGTYLHVWGQSQDGQWRAVVDQDATAGWMFASLIIEEPLPSIYSI